MSRSVNSDSTPGVGGVSDKINTLAETINGLKIMQNKIISSLNFASESIRIQDKKFESKFGSFSGKLTDVVNENVTLKAKIDELESKLDELGHNQVRNSSNVHESIFSELLDRQFRARNIIIFEVPDHDCPTRNNISEDVVVVDDLLKTIGVAVDPISVRRLGQFSNKPRPIRVVLPSPNDVFDVLRAKKKILSVDKYKKIRISNDQTPLQRKYFSTIVSEIKSRRNSGETDLYIKFINKVPIISKSGKPFNNS